MRMAIKNRLPELQAWELGAGSDMEQQLLAAGKLVRHPDGSYELFSQEAVSGKGQLAAAGDYLKLDTAGFPYPNARDHFLAQHIPVEGKTNTWTQKAAPLAIWKKGDPLVPELAFLLQSDRLTLDESHPDRYFSAVLWGAPLSAADNAVLVFYSVTRAPDGSILDADFNFVAAAEFAATYSEL